jgi:hypothetical protein
MFDLVAAVSVPAPADTKQFSPDYTMEKSAWSDAKERRYKPWPHILDRQKKHGSHRDEWSTKVLMQPAVRDAIAKLDAAICDGLAGTFAEGKRRGRSLLASLAMGEVSTTKYDGIVKKEEEQDADDGDD